MATKKTKKEYTPEMAVDAYKDILNRCGVTNTYITDDIILAVTDDPLLCIVADHGLLDILKNELSPPPYELGIFNGKIQAFKNISHKPDSDWYPIDMDKLYTGDMIKIHLKIGDESRCIEFNKSFLPIRLRKAEFKDILYIFILDPFPFLCIRKVFQSPLDGYSFQLLRGYKIL